VRWRADIRLDEELELELELGFLVLVESSLRLPGKAERKLLVGGEEGVDGERGGSVLVSGRAVLAGLMASIRPEACCVKIGC